MQRLITATSIEQVVVAYEVDFLNVIVAQLVEFLPSKQVVASSSLVSHSNSSANSEGSNPLWREFAISVA